MSRYYRGRRARRYNQHWPGYTEKTLAMATAMIDFDALRRVPEELGHPPRVLDVACGTGTLLKRLIERVPNVEAYGVDASADMLAQARETLKDQPHARLERIEVGGGEPALPYLAQTFDLITCTNVLHDIRDPAAFLSVLRRVLALGGQLVLEDFARRQPAWLWAVFEWLLSLVEKGQVRAYTLAEGQAFCARANLRIVCAKDFPIDWLWHGWALRAG